MSFCRNCGLSISETATFCGTCGATVLADTASSTEAPAVAAAADWAPPDDQPAAQVPYADAGPCADAGLYADAGTVAAPAPKPVALSRVRIPLWIVWAAVASILFLFGVLEVVVVAQSVDDLRTVTLEEYALLKPGMDETQVANILGTGGTPTQETTSEPGGVVYRWENEDGSYVTVVYVNGVVARMSQSGLERTNPGRTLFRNAVGSSMSAPMTVIAFLIWAACLYSAATFRGYEISVPRILMIAVVCTAVGFVVGLIPIPTIFLRFVIGVSIQLAVFIALIMWAAGADLVEAVIIFFVDWFFSILAWIPMTLGFWLAWSILK